MERALFEKVSDSIYTMCYKLDRDNGAAPFTIFDLVDALKSKGYTLEEDKEEIKLYTSGYMSDQDDYFLVKMKHGDCVLQKYQHNSGMTIFAKRGYRNGTYVREMRLEDVVEMIVRVDNELPAIIKKCQKAILQSDKNAKKLAINKRTLDTMVKTALKGTGIKYRLSLADQRALLTLQLDHGLETNIHLSYKNFMDTIPHIQSTVERLNEIMKELEQPLRIKATYYREKDTWTESK